MKPDQLTPAMRRLLPKDDPLYLVGKEVSSGTRVRQSRKGPNKLEREWFELLRERPFFYYTPTLRLHAKTYLLANGVRYTPDVTVSFWPIYGKETAWEVKGPWATDDALVKLKVAAREWPEVVWILVWKEDGCWKEQVILP